MTALNPHTGFHKGLFGGEGKEHKEFFSLTTTIAHFYLALANIKAINVPSFNQESQLVMLIISHLIMV